MGFGFGEVAAGFSPSHPEGAGSSSKDGRIASMDEVGEHGDAFLEPRMVGREIFGPFQGGNREDIFSCLSGFTTILLRSLPNSHMLRACEVITSMRRLPVTEGAI